MIINLLYVISSRPGIMQDVGLGSRLQVNSNEMHLNVVKLIFKYLQGTHEYGLWYPKSKHFNLITFTNSDFVGSIHDKKSTSRGAHFLGDCLVSLERKKKSCISLSTTEAQYIATTTCCTQILCMKKTLRDMHVEYEEPLRIMVDNTSAIIISKYTVLHSNTKHIPIKYDFLREQVVNKVVKLEYITSNEKIVDIFTKPLPREQFEYLRE